MNLLNEEQNYLKMDEPTANKSPASYRPVPKPRKSLMTNTAAAAVASASSAAAAISAAQSTPSKPPADFSTKGRQFHSSPSSSPLYDNKTPPPPPLPPRTPFSISPLAVQQQHYRPFQPPNSSLPEKIDFSTSKMEQRQQILTDDAAGAAENNTNRNGLLNKIYPTLDNLLGQQKLAAEMASSSSTTKAHSLTMLNINKNNNNIPMDTASNNSSSDFSSDDYHSVADSPAATFSTAANGNTNITATTFAAYPSFYEPFGDVKSDGESVCFSGWVQMAPQGGLIKHRKRGFAMIRQGQFFITPDEETDLPFFGPTDLCKCVYLGKNLAGNRTEIMLIFRDYNAHGKLQKSTAAAMAATNSHHQPQNGDEALQCVLRFTPEENGDYWLPLLAKQCCSPRNELLDDCLSLDCFGRLWIKQGVSGIWNEGCAFASKRILHFWLEGPPAQLAQIDIRKIILIKRKDIPSSDWCNRIEHSGQGPILIALEGSSLYLQAQNDQCTANWLEFLNGELRVEPNTLEECRLTSDDVPVIVDKCIRLISTYGLYQQGIYRKSGSAAESKRLMAAFREDPYAVHLKSPITDETIFAVAGVLRTFFRQLNSPLIPVRMHGKLYEISNIPLADKPRQYQALICSLPKVYFKTLRKLLGHLQEIISHESRNFASLDNISKIFGPTLFNESNQTDEEVSVEWYTMATKQTLVMRDLIFHYCDIFGVSADELLAKCKLDVIQEQKSSKNPATGMLVPIHLFEKDHKCFNIQSEWTAGQVVAFKLDKLAFISAAVESYALFEVVRNGQLERRIGANETLLSIVLGRWLDWEEHQNNFLLLKKDLHPFQPQTGRAFADDLKIAEPGSKSFKSASLRIEEGTRVCQYSKTLKRQNEWKVDEMLWFMGAELDRKCPFPFALTFFLVGGGNGGNEEKRKWGTTTAGTSANSVAKCRGKLPGFCVAFRDEVQRHQWMNCICLNQSEYLPQPLIQI